MVRCSLAAARGAPLTASEHAAAGVCATLAAPAALAEARLRAAVSACAGNGTINYSEFVHVLLKPLDLPKPIEIPPELKEYWDQVKSKSDGKSKE